MSFNEGHTSNIIEVSSKSKIDFIEKSNFLVNFIDDNISNEFTYRLNFNNKNELQEFKKKLDAEKNIEKINVIYN